MDPLQFAYQPIREEDAIFFPSHKALGEARRVMFFDFSSTFDTIQPCPLEGKLPAMQLHSDTTSWIMDYLTVRPKYVRVDGCASVFGISNIGAPQATGTYPLHYLHLRLTLQLWYVLPSKDFHQHQQWQPGGASSHATTTAITWCSILAKLKSWWWTIKRNRSALTQLSFRERKWRGWTCGPNEQKSGLVSQHGSALHERTEQTVLPEETQIPQCMQHATEERSVVAIALFFAVVC